MSRDILPDLIRQVLELAGADVTVSSAIEPRIRQQYGGERYYVAKHAPAEKKSLLVGSGYASGLTTSQISAVLGIPERTVRWHARRRWPVI